MYNILNKEGNNDTNDKTTGVTQTGATATAGSTIGCTYTATTNRTIPTKVMAAINQLSANQAAIMFQTAANSFSPQSSIAVLELNVPPSNMCQSLLIRHFQAAFSTGHWQLTYNVVVP